MTGDPWTADDPNPGDFDVLLASVDPKYVQRRDGDPRPTLRILISVEGEDALRLERIATERQMTSDAVVADLIRAADRAAG